MSDLLTVKEAAEALGISKGRVRALNAAFYRNKAGKLVEVKSGGRVYITRTSVNGRLQHFLNKAAKAAAYNEIDEIRKRENRERIDRQKARLAMHRERVLEEIKRSKNGLTTLECSDVLGLDSSIVRRLINHLRENNLVRENGKRKSDWGGSVIVWIACDE